MFFETFPSHLLRLLALCLTLYDRFLLKSPRVAILLKAVPLPHTPVLVLHHLPLHATRLPKPVLVLDRAAAPGEQHAQPGHLGEGDHAGRVGGVKAWLAGEFRLDAFSDLTKNLPGTKICFFAGLVIKVDAGAGEASAHSAGNWEEEDEDDKWEDEKQ